MSRRQCPYVFCSAFIELEWARTNPSDPEALRQLMPWHNIVHPWLTGGCPASLMWIPLDEDSAEALTRRAVIDRRAIEDRIEIQDELGRAEKDQKARDGGLFPQRPLYPRGPGKLPGRMGREPGPQSGTWNPPRPGDPVNQPVPPDTGGQALGKGPGRHVASIQELVAQVTEANVKSGEAAASAGECVHVLGAALASIQEAKASIAAAIDGSQAATLTEYLGILQSAEDKIQQAIPPLEEASGELASGMEKGETYIGMALG